MCWRVLWQRRRHAQHIGTGRASNRSRATHDGNRFGQGPLSLSQVNSIQVIAAAPSMPRTAPATGVVAGGRLSLPVQRVHGVPSTAIVGVLLRRTEENTDEWTFGDERGMVGRSHNKLTAWKFGRCNKKLNTFNVVKCRLVGNNKSGKNFPKISKRY